MSALPHICVVGAGTMGRGIAQVALGAGHTVSLVDPSADQLSSATAEVISRLTRRNPDARDEVLDRLSTCASLSVVTQRDDVILIEAAVENLDVKRAIFTEAVTLFGPDCILATNTSSLSITEIAAGVPEPSRVVGMHFFNPVPVMRLVEIVQGLQTDPDVLETITGLAHAWGKEPAPAKSAPGFIVNRVARPFYGEALRLLEEGAASESELDELLRSTGFRMGPFELMDLIGLDVNYTVTCTVWAAFNYDPRFAPSHVQRELVAGGFHGRKTGRGFHRYDETGGTGTATEHTPLRAALPPGLVLQGAAPDLNAILERAGARAERTAGQGRLLVGDLGAIVTTRGLTASAEARQAGHPIVVVDRTLDPTSVGSLAIAGTSKNLLEAAVGLLGAAGIRTVVMDDTPGLVVARIVSMLANEAWETVNHGTAEPAAIDQAMKLGTNYPLGPIEWAERWGAASVQEILDNVWAEYRDSRYRVSRLLRRAAG